MAVEGRVSRLFREAMCRAASGSTRMDALLKTIPNADDAAVRPVPGGSLRPAPPVPPGALRPGTRGLAAAAGRP